ncbi:MAG: hypothetical protein JO222_06460, partial [Frankiales bacterium]|nr:hypothetical protein [Frankiales bacterium]
MTHPFRWRVLATAAVVPLIALAGACGGSEKDKEAGAATASCTGKLLPAQSNAALPSGFPAPSGAVFYQLSTVGQTQVHFAYVRGD